jgi:hypothetical protein
MGTVDFEPCDVVLVAPMTLAGTMHKAELEWGAALVVRALQRANSPWCELTLVEVIASVRADVDEGVEPIASLSRNPFFQPDVRGLAKDGYAVVTDTTIKFTDKGLEALRRWAKQRAEGA